MVPENDTPCLFGTYRLSAMFLKKTHLMQIVMQMLIVQEVMGVL